MEFQKTVNPLMPVRMTIYVGLLWQALWGGRARKIENNRRKNCNSAVKLVHIFHIIIYNGNHELIWLHLYKSFLNLYQVNQRNIIQ